MTGQELKTENVRWDLSVFYSGIGDPQIGADISKLVRLQKRFHARYKGNLSWLLDSAIKDLGQIRMLESKVSIYLFLLESLDVANSVVKEKKAEAELVLSQAEGEYMTFFSLELQALDDEAL